MAPASRTPSEILLQRVIGSTSPRFALEWPSGADMLLHYRSRV